MPTKGDAQYRSALRSCVRGLWSGVFDYYDFYDKMMQAIDYYFTRAWHAAAKECGIAADEMTPDEKIALEQAKNYEYQWIDRFAQVIIDGSKANGGKLQPLMTRLEVWAGRYEGVKSKARTMACGDQKLEWTLGATEHCSSCLKLAGKVKRASYWHKMGILPRVHDAAWLE